MKRADDIIEITKLKCLIRKRVENDEHHPHTQAQKDEMRKQKMTIFLMTAAFKNNALLQNYVILNRNNGWNNGRMSTIVISIETFFIMT